MKLQILTFALLLLSLQSAFAQWPTDSTISEQQNQYANKKDTVFCTEESFSQLFAAEIGHNILLPFSQEGEIYTISLKTVSADFISITANSNKNGNVLYAEMPTANPKAKWVGMCLSKQYKDGYQFYKTDEKCFWKKRKTSQLISR